MPIIKPSSDLRNNYNEISTICHQTKSPVYITKNGIGDLAVMSIEFIKKNIAFSDNISVQSSTKSDILSSNCHTSPFFPLP